MASAPLSPSLSPEQRRSSSREYGPVPENCVVTGGTGFVGIRLVEMLVERGAKRVVAFDVVPKDKTIGAWDHPAIHYVVGDITNYEQVASVIEGADCVWHLAAAVGPFHPKHLYKKVNYGGTLNVIRACKAHGVHKLVFSSSPSTRFVGSLTSRPSIDGLTEDEMPKLPLRTYMQPYAETKAMGEMAASAACDDSLFVVNVAPHQVYGPRDNLFMPNILETAGTGKLHVFGDGLNRVCFTHVDNYAHALIIAERKLFAGSPVLGKFYIATDGDTHPEPKAYAILWKEIDRAVVGMGFTSLFTKVKFPFPLIYVLALFGELFGWLFGSVFKLNVFNVFVLTMHRWFTITAIEKDLGYKPVIEFRPGWNDTIAWFRGNWLPGFEQSNKSVFGISARSQMKIDTQNAGTSRK